VRENLDLRDGFFQNNEESQLKVIQMIRKYQPEIVLCNAIKDRHIDHGKGSKLVSDILTEAKVTTSDRNTCMVLVDDNSVLWCVGHKISRKAIADNHCRNILKVQIVEK
jgi:tRNA(Ile)-lysidine synthetase-like protein